MSPSNRDGGHGFRSKPLIPRPDFHSSHTEGIWPPPSPLYLLEVLPKPLHDTRQMARQTDGPFTQASRNRHGPARDEDVGTDGDVTKTGEGGAWPLASTTTPGRAGGSPGNTNPTNKGFSFHDPGESNSEDGEGVDLNTPVTMTVIRQGS